MKGRLAYGDRHARQLVIVDIATLKHLGQCPADHFTDAQHALCGGLTGTVCLLCHAPHVALCARNAKLGFTSGAKPR